MRKSIFIAATVIAVLGLGFAGYVFLVDRSNNVEQAEAITAETFSGELPDKSSDPSANETFQEFLDGPYWHSDKSGPVTEFFLDGGDIGYVDVGSILTDRNSYSVVALLQQHSEHTGADELLELEIVSAGGRGPKYNALFVQVIEGVPMEKPGSIVFDANGTVSLINGDLVSTMEAEIGDIVIQQAEAENIAVDAARRYSTVFRRNNGFDSSEEPLRIEAHSGKFHYATVPSADNSLRAEWRIAVTIYGAPWSVEVTVGATAGNVFGVKRLIEPAASSTGCSELTFRVCDATTMVKSSSRTCGEGVVQGGRPVLDGNSCVAQNDQGRCSNSRYTGIRNNANGIRDYIKRIGKSAEKDYLSGVGGADCKIDILINVGTDLMETVNGEPVDGQYEPATDVILIREDHRDPKTGRIDEPVFSESLIVHEILHAVSKGSGPIEHGLVDAMEALHVGPDSDSNWTYGDIKDFTDPQKINGRDAHSVVGNAVYRIYKKSRNKDLVFEFAMEIETRRPRNLRDFRREIVSVVSTFPSDFQRAVAEVLVDMGINDLPLNAVPVSILRFMEAKLREIAAAASPQDPIQAAWAEAMRRLREELGLDDDEVLRSRPATGPKPPPKRWGS